MSKKQKIQKERIDHNTDGEHAKKRIDPLKIVFFVLLTVLTILLIKKGFIFHKVRREVIVDGVKSSKKVSVLSFPKLSFLLFLYAFSAWFCFWKPKFSEKTQRCLMWLITYLSPVFLYLLLELNFYSGFTKFKILITFGNLLILYTCMFVCLAFTNSFRATMLIPYCFWLVFSVMNIYIRSIRGTSIVISDLILWKSALQVADSFKFKITTRNCLILICALVFFMAVFKLKEMKYAKKPSVRICLMILSVFAVNTTLNDAFTRNYFDIKKVQYLPQRSYRKYGTALTLVRSGKVLMIDKPEGYSPQTVDDIIAEYPSDDPEGFDVKKAPTIIAIMNEAYSDLEGVFGLENTQDAMPYFRSLKENVIDGNMAVSIRGGQTANTEYEFLTGNSKAFVSGGVAPYQSYMKKEEEHISLVHDLKAIGYGDMIAFHPYNTKGYNRVQAYENLGFDCFMSEKSIEDPQYLRDFISDQCDFDELIRYFEQNRKEGKAPMFLFNVTMQNHLPFDEYFDNMEYPIKVLTEGCTGTDYQVYENLIHETDKAYQNLIEYFEKQQEDVIIVMFGDHQPSINAPNEGSMPLGKYIVPFKIWANYDIEEEHYECISPNFLGTLLMKEIGAPLTGYQKFQLDFFEQIPTLSYYGYLDRNGNLYDVEDRDSPYYDLLVKYHCLQYNNLHDKDNTRRDFFYLGGESHMNPNYYVN